VSEVDERAGAAGGARGLFITFEGGDGSGKSTQAERLVAHLKGSGLEVLHTREPGGTEVGVEIRELVLHHRGDIDPRAEALLYAADRAHHIATVVRPALAAGTIVVQDRYLDSSVAYQGVGRELDAAEIRELSLWATGQLLPDLTVLLDIDQKAARARLDAANKRFDRLEAQGSDFHERVRTAFLALAEVEPRRFLVVDGSSAADELAASVASHVDALLAARARTPEAAETVGVPSAASAVPDSLTP
jgi:dTMP kinase